MPNRLLLALCALALASPAQAQLLPFLRPKPPPAPVVVEAPPPPTPEEYWEGKEPDLEDRQDPLGDRRATRGEIAAPRRIDNGVDPLMYRLWGLPPLQNQLVRTGDAVLEAWVRPSGSVRQAIIRITVRRDGRSFVQARAGLACCRPEIIKRVGIDEEMLPGAGAAFEVLATDALWNQPTEVRPQERGSGAVDSLCAGGVAYDLTLVTATRAYHLRRNCDPVEVGSIAPVLGPMVAAVLGKNGYIDYLFPKGADFGADAQAYQAFVASGGRLTPRPRQ